MNALRWFQTKKQLWYWFQPILFAALLIQGMLIIPSALALREWDDSVSTSPFLQQELMTGNYIDKVVQQSFPISHRADLQNYVVGLIRKLSPYSPVQYPFKVVIIADERSAYSFSAPGGILYVSEALIHLTESESQLAGLLAHDMIHVAKRHIFWQYQERQLFWTDPQAQSETLDDTLILGQTVSMQAPATQEAMWIDAMQFQAMSPDLELEADIWAAYMLKRAGFNPKGYRDWLQKLNALTTSGVYIQYNDVHPLSDQRVSIVDEAMARFQWDAPGLIVDSQRYHDAVEGTRRTTGS